MVELTDPCQKIGSTASYWLTFKVNWGKFWVWLQNWHFEWGWKQKISRSEFNLDYKRVLESFPFLIHSQFINQFWNHNNWFVIFSQKWPAPEKVEEGEEIGIRFTRLVKLAKAYCFLFVAEGVYFKIDKGIELTRH